MLEYIIANGWSLIAATIILGFVFVIATFFIAFSVSFMVNMVYGAYRTIRGPNGE